MCRLAVVTTLYGSLAEFGLYRQDAANEINDFDSCKIIRTPRGASFSTKTGSFLTLERCQTTFNEIMRNEVATLEIPTGPTDVGEYYCGTTTSTHHYLHSTPVIIVEQLLGKVF